MNIRYIWNRIFKKISSSAITNSKIGYDSKIEAGSQIVNSIINDHSFCGYNCKLINCKVGKYTSIADGVIIGVVQHPYNWGSTSPAFYSGKDSIKAKFSYHIRPNVMPTIIGNDVWIGENVLIKGGITISDGAVIGMGAVVTKNVGPYEVWAGNPAKFIKKRFDDSLIDLYMKNKWWNCKEEIIKVAARFVKEPSMFIDEIRRLARID